MGLFVVFPIFDSFIHSFSVEFYAQLTPTNLLNPWILIFDNSFGYFDFKNNQLFSKYHARKVPRKEVNAVKVEVKSRGEKVQLFFFIQCFLKQKIYQ